jgi:hypothetical protein
MSRDGRKLAELHIPPEVWEDENARELLRAWAANKSLHVSFQTDWNEPWKWGMFLADMARHAARALASENLCSQTKALAEIRDKFEQELDSPTDVGTTSELKRQ